MNIRYVSWVGTSGYAVAAQGYLLALHRTDMQVGWIPLFPNDPRTGGWSEAESTEAASQVIASLCTDETTPTSYNGRCVRELVNRVSREQADASVIHIVPELWSAQRGHSGLTVGNIVWETDKLPGHWPALINAVDRVIVPCEFNKKVMRECGVRVPIHVIPHVAPAIVAPPSEAEVADFRMRRGLASDQTLFYCIEEWNPRKAPYKTIAAFLRAFGPDDGARLVVKTSGFGPRSGATAEYRPTTDLAEEILAGFDRAAPVTVISGDVPRRDIELLHEVGDCYISLTHGEGWGIGAYEAAAAGNPVITTGWGGPLDYLGEDWPYLIDYELVPVLYLSGLPSFHPTQRWAAAEPDHAVALLQEVFGDLVTARRRASEPAERIRRDFGLEATAERLRSALQT